MLSIAFFSNMLIHIIFNFDITLTQKTKMYLTNFIFIVINKDYLQTIKHCIIIEIPTFWVINETISALFYSTVDLTVRNKSYCEVVRWKTEHDQSSLKKEGFSKQQIPLREGGNLTYWEGGQGQPLLLLHGFGGTAAATWKAEMIQLSKKYRVIAPDLLWFGESYSDNSAQLATQTNAIWQLVDKLKLKKIDVAGISYGGFITYDMMLTPERINKAVIIASPGPLFNDQDLSDLVQRAGIQSPEELFVPNNGDGVKRLYDNVFIDKKIIPDFIANQIYHDYFSQWKLQRTQLIKTLPNDRDRIHQYDPKKLPQTLLIWGRMTKFFRWRVV